MASIDLVSAVDPRIVASARAVGIAGFNWALIQAPVFQSGAVVNWGSAGNVKGVSFVMPRSGRVGRAGKSINFNGPLISVVKTGGVIAQASQHFGCQANVTAFGIRWVVA